MEIGKLYRIFRNRFGFAPQFCTSVLVGGSQESISLFHLDMGGRVVNILGKFARVCLRVNRTTDFVIFRRMASYVVAVRPGKAEGSVTREVSRVDVNECRALAFVPLKPTNPPPTANTNRSSMNALMMVGRFFKRFTSFLETSFVLTFLSHNLDSIATNRSVPPTSGTQMMIS